MNNQTSVNERIKKISESLFKGNTSAMARATFISQSTLRDIISEKAKPSYDTIKNIVECPTIDVSLDWLITGKGEMLKVDGVSTTPIKTQTEVETRPRVPYDAAAGSLALALTGVTVDECEQLPVVAGFQKYDYSLFAKGDSMEPELHSGDEMFCKSITNSGFIKWGDIHVLDTSQGIIVKRIYEDGEYILCKSEFEEKFKDFRIAKYEVYNIGLVVGMLRRY